MHRFGKDAEGYYVTPVTFAPHAGAPCFEPNERFRVCPVAQANSPVAQSAYRWRQLAENGLVSFIADVPSAFVGNAIRAAISAVNSRERFELREK